ncbi:hypothetical protein OZX73_05315 [Bifidobacterium sp. ESL0775]|uniref:hypothetical protein n=1 Tax=Bifidobacterium sp. ESL0775 TaxID=2983230 RepID=UPI0023F86C70|nr:hypothetical protein [Bifidobacterium sp. ESL0775]WEV68711.1 hypothetical protein OZX73_05315 [Bifidobacterium sp. ESL0775]
MGTASPSVRASEAWTPQRYYMPGTADPFLVSQRAAEKREREKHEANRPTGTEIQQIKRKLQEQQEQILRAMPTVATYKQSIGGVSLGGGWVALESMPVRRDTGHGKTRALLLVGVTAVKSGEGIPLLEAMIGGTRIGSFPGVTANGDSFGGTTSLIVNADQVITLYGRSTVEAPSPIGGVDMTVTVMSIA